MSASVTYRWVSDLTCFWSLREVARLYLIGSITLLSGLALAEDTRSQNPVITLKREQTYPWTPAYVVQLYRDGRVVYIGGGAAKIWGVQTSTVEVSAVNELLADFDRIGFARLRDPEGPRYADKPSTHVTLHTIGKTMSLGGHGPLELVPLVAKIERVADLKKWVCPLNHPYGDAPKCYLD